MPEPLLAPIAWARSIGKRRGLRSVIVLQELPDGRWGFTSWGKTRADCQRAQRIAAYAMGEAEDSADALPEREP